MAAPTPPVGRSRARDWPLPPGPEQEVQVTTPPLAAPAIAQLRQRFDPTFALFLTQLHQRGKQSVEEIYGDYNRSLVVRTLDQDDQFWVEQLGTLLRGLREINRPVYLQKDEHGPQPLDVAANCSCYLDGAEVETAEAFEDLLFGVYWFEKAGGGASGKHRVYLHLADPIATHGVAVLRALVPLLDVIPGFQKIKMFGPIGGHNRNDSIVAYFTDADAQRTLAAAAGRLPAGHLQADLPQWVKAASPGVGLADEPPQTEVFRNVDTGTLPYLDDLRADDTGRQSFGKFLSKLIWMAQLYNTDGTEEGFLERVLVAFRVARMDPRNPHRHSRSAIVEAMQPGLAQSLHQALKLEGVGGRASLRHSMG
jgi:hypothetical protein